MHPTRVAALLLVTSTLAMGSGTGRSMPQEPVLWALTFTPGPGWDSTRPPNEQRYFREHSANLQRLRRDSVIVAGGRFGRFGLMILRAPSEDAVRRAFAEDSTIVTQVFEITVDRWYTIYRGNL